MKRYIYASKYVAIHLKTSKDNETPCAFQHLKIFTKHLKTHAYIASSCLFPQLWDTFLLPLESFVCCEAPNHFWLNSIRASGEMLCVSGCLVGGGGTVSCVAGGAGGRGAGGCARHCGDGRVLAGGCAKHCGDC